MAPAPQALSGKQKILIAMVAILVIVSIGYHKHPSMSGLHDELAAKAPTIFKLFVGGESCYFLGMILMAAGLGATLGPNPLLWGGKFKAMMSAESKGLARATVFWAGFVFNALGSLTFSVIGIYVALKILPGGSWTIIPAAFTDLAFSVFIRLVFFQRFRKMPEKTA